MLQGHFLAELPKSRVAAWGSIFVVVAMISVANAHSQSPRRLNPPAEIIETKKVTIQIKDVPAATNPRPSRQLTGTLLLHDSERISLLSQGRHMDVPVEDVVSIEEIRVDEAFAEEQFRHARESHKTGKYDKAIAIAKDLLSFDLSDQVNRAAHRIIAESYFISDDLQEFQSYVTKALDAGASIEFPLVHYHSQRDRLDAELRQWWTGEDGQGFAPDVRDLPHEWRRSQAPTTGRTSIPARWPTTGRAR